MGAQSAEADAAPFLEQLGARVKGARTALGLSTGDLAARSGVSRRMIAYIETVETNPSVVTVLRLATALDMDLADLLASTSARSDRASRLSALQ